jgi:F-type H+-transporting ATPase subunit gamma
MESPQLIKSRLRAVQNVGQITKAMEVVAATKMRRAQEAALASREYAWKALELLAKASTVSHLPVPFTASREVRTTLLVVVASDRGLAGSFNTQVLRAVDAFLEKDASEHAPGHAYQAVVVGKRAAPALLRQGIDVIKIFERFGDASALEDVAPLSSLIVSGYESGKFDRVVAISTHFRTTLRQDVLVRAVLPLRLTDILATVREIVPESGRFSEKRRFPLTRPDTEHDFEYILEPGPEELVTALVPHLVRMELHHLVLEANASEHSARMVAMKTASDNAKELSGELQLQFNKARQADITKEIIEITSTQNALA